MNLVAAYDDKELVTLLKGGDRRAFTEIYNRYWERLYGLAYTHLKSEVQTEEILQDVFLTLWRKKDQLEIEYLPAYLAAMTRHAVYKMLAKNKKTVTVETKAASNLTTPTNELTYIENRNLLDIVEKLTNVLPEKCRLVFIYNKLLDKSIDELSEIMNISTKTAEAHLTKALKIVRAHLDQISTDLKF